MKVVPILLWILAMSIIADWTFFAPAGSVTHGAPEAPPQSAAPPSHNSNSGPLPDPKSLVRAEDGRQMRREGMLKVLEQPWATFCSETGSKKLASSLSYYYEFRRSEVLRSISNYGAKVGEETARLNQAPEDLRIDRITRQLFAGGYFKLADIRKYSLPKVTEIVQDEKTTGHACD